MKLSLSLLAPAAGLAVGLFALLGGCHSDGPAHRFKVGQIVLSVVDGRQPNLGPLQGSVRGLRCEEFELREEE